MPKVTLALFLLLSSLPIAAQTRIDAGVSLGRQSYRDDEENPRFLPSGEVLARHNTAGLHAAVEYTDLIEFGAMVATHVNAIYRRGDRYFFLAGAGPTFVYVDPTVDVTFNVELEIGRAWRSTEIFVRGRYYDFSQGRFPA